ncbi:MAG: hypothetical protein N2C14_32520, partial [Planctomycetales bacterium]
FFTHPDTPLKSLVPADVENKNKLHSALGQVELILKTKGKEALQIALATKPDAIYILTDGRFTDKAEDWLMSVQSQMFTLTGKPTPIHTVLFTKAGKPDALGEAALKRISKAYNGTFRAVPKKKGAGKKPVPVVPKKPAANPKKPDPKKKANPNKKNKLTKKKKQPAKKK